MEKCPLKESPSAILHPDDYAGLVVRYERMGLHVGQDVFIRQTLNKWTDSVPLPEVIGGKTQAYSPTGHNVLAAGRIEPFYKVMLMNRVANILCAIDHADRQGDGGYLQVSFQSNGTGNGLFMRREPDPTNIVYTVPVDSPLMGDYRLMFHHTCRTVQAHLSEGRGKKTSDPFVACFAGTLGEAWVCAFKGGPAREQMEIRRACKFSKQLCC
jgi:hypothetical protein